MRVLKCPKCGRLCREGVLPFPRCGRCHEHLLTCRYCGSYDAQMLDCDSPFRPEGFRVRDPDLYLACPHHRTTLEVGLKVVRRRVWVPGLVLVAMAAVVAVLLPRFLTGEPSGQKLHARVAPVDEAYLHETEPLVMQIWNPGPGRCEQVIVALNRSYEKHVKLDYVEPEPSAQRRTRKWERLWFPGLEEGDVLELRLHVTPVKTGTWQMAAEIMTPGASRREKIKATLEIMP